MMRTSAGARYTHWSRKRLVGRAYASRQPSPTGLSDPSSDAVDAHACVVGTCL